MKRIIFTLIWLVFWTALESTFLRHFPSENVRCDIAFLTVIAIGFTMEWHEGFVLVAIIGIFMDAISPSAFGIFTFIYIIAFGVIRFATAVIYVKSRFGQFVWTAAASVLVMWLEALFFILVYKNTNYLPTLLIRFVPQAVWNAFLILPVVPVYTYFINLSWDKLFRPKGLVMGRD